jgi:hypothetical protein
VLDKSGAPTSGHVAWPEGLQPVPWPPYSPELNPGERWCKELREPLSNQVPDRLEALEASLTKALRQYGDYPLEQVHLIAYPWWRNGAQYITS